jgi:tRNA(Ile)-lysidine synthase
MPRSHPPSLVRLTERLVRDEQLFARGDVVLCACSGGPDSTALLSALAHLRRRIGNVLVAHGVDHGLREEARAELELARDVAAQLDVPFAITRVDVAPGGNLQARARDARLAALEDAAALASARVVATGHTADDRAETFLIRLLRGAGVRGLAVLPPSAPSPSGRVTLIRPMLLARRADVEAHLARHRLVVARDPSNLDPRFTRVRVRRELLPLLESLSPRVVEHLATLADALAEVPDPDAALGLGRGQRLQVDRARRLGRSSVKIRVGGGNDREVRFPRDAADLIEAEGRQSEQSEQSAASPARRTTRRT